MTATNGSGVSAPTLSDTIQSLRPFVPSKDFQVSKSFYQTLGFELRHDGPDLAVLAFGAASFLLQNFYAEELAKNFVVQLNVTDVAAWWRRVEPMDLVGRYGVRPLQAPRPMPWNATVLFLFDPAGVLWHISEYDAAPVEG